MLLLLDGYTYTSPIAEKVYIYICTEERELYRGVTCERDEDGACVLIDLMPFKEKGGCCFSCQLQKATPHFFFLCCCLRIFLFFSFSFSRLYLLFFYIRFLQLFDLLLFASTPSTFVCTFVMDFVTIDRSSCSFLFVVGGG